MSKSTAGPHYPSASAGDPEERLQGTQIFDEASCAFALLLFEQARLQGVVALKPGCISLGRDERCGGHLSDPGVSRQHCLVRLSQGQVTLHDAGSTNGTYRFGKRVQHVALNCGDEFTIGGAVVKLVDLGRAKWKPHADLFSELYEDPATGLPNPRGFALGHDASMPTLPPGMHVAMAFLCFERALGGAAAENRSARDAAMADLGARLRRLLPPGAVFGRTGACELGVFTYGATRLSNLEVVHRMKLEFALPSFDPEWATSGRAALGASLRTLPTESASLRCSALDALHLARGGPGSGFVVFGE